MKKLIILVLLSTYLFSGTFYTPITKINFIGVYNTSSKAGNVIFTLENTHANCSGYYIEKSDIGYESTLSAILSAYHAKNNVRVYSSTTYPLMPSSSTSYCKVYTIQYK